MNERIKELDCFATLAMTDSAEFDRGVSRLLVLNS
jgi:hypothetical protein